MTIARIPAGFTGGLLALSLTLAGCGEAATAPAGPAPATSATAQAGAQFNDADIAFAQMMGPHHRQAVEMAEIAADRAQSPEVKALAEKIRAAQEPEITQLTDFLNAWGAEVPAANSMTGTGHSGTSGMSEMPRMMTPEQMAELHNTAGAAFDQRFLTMMIEHHRGAIAAAEREVNEGSNPDAKQLAERIAADQNAEITRMQQLLAG